MLKVVWIPAVAAAPDADAFRSAVDTLTASFHDDMATAHFPRDPSSAPTGIDELSGVVERWLGVRSVPAAPPKLMLHGYDFDPRHTGDPAFDPFTGIYGYPVTDGPDPRLSWLPLVEEYDPATRRLQETAIAFAWVSTGSMAEYATAGWSESYEYACVDLACLAAKALAGLLGVLVNLGTAVDVLAHSLGTRLFTQAVRLRSADAPLNNVILLDGAEFSVDAAAVFKGRGFSVVNVTNEVDAVLAAGGEQLGDPSRQPGTLQSCCLGRFGLGTVAGWGDNGGYPGNWVDIALDRRDVLAWFKANGGYALTATASDNVHPLGNMNHWACYTEPGNRAWVTDLLWKPAMNGAALAANASLPKGILGPTQPVFAGVGIPTTTPMTLAARLAYQQGAGQGVG